MVRTIRNFGMILVLLTGILAFEGGGAANEDNFAKPSCRSHKGSVGFYSGEYSGSRDLNFKSFDPPRNLESFTKKTCPQDDKMRPAIESLRQILFILRVS